MGKYSEYFGSPEFQVQLRNGIIEDIQVIRGAPCGATWQVVGNLLGMQKDEAVTKLGLDTQINCIANPAGWDPIGGKSPVHFAGEIHARALKKAIQKVQQ